MLRGSEYLNRLESAELPAFNDCLRRIDLLVDVGASVGFFTLIASRAGVTTLAIEPSPLNLRHLYENLRLAAGSGDVEILPVAVSDTIGVGNLLGSGQGASLQPGWGNVVSNYVTPVPTTTLDSILAGRAGHLLVKIDVEGNENAVLRGAAATLRRSPQPTWLVEHGPRVQDGYLEFFQEFWSNGYGVIALPESRARAPYQVDSNVAAAWTRTSIAPDLMFLCKPNSS
jgi:FkbM family methyltransferase